MPVKRLTREESNAIGDIIDDYEEEKFSWGSMMEQINEIFAKIYGYRRPGRAKSRVRDSRPKAKKPRSKKQKANDKRIGRLMKQGYSMKEAHRVNAGGY